MKDDNPARSFIFLAKEKARETRYIGELNEQAINLVDWFDSPIISQKGGE